MLHRHLRQAVDAHGQLARLRAVGRGTGVVDAHLGTYPVVVAQVAQIDGVGRKVGHQRVVAIPFYLRVVLGGTLQGGHKAHLLALAHIVAVAADADGGALRAAHHDGLAVGVLACGVVAYAQGQLVGTGLGIGVGQVACRLVVNGAVALHVPGVLRLCRCPLGLVEDDDLLTLADGVAADE